MNVENVKSLFSMFSGDDECDERYMPIINLAVSEVEGMTQGKSSDPRLDFLAAALANFRLCQLNSARDRSTVTVGGKTVSNGGDTVLKYAEKMLNEYMALCGDIVTAREFAFIAG